MSLQKRREGSPHPPLSVQTAFMPAKSLAISVWVFLCFFSLPLRPFLSSFHCQIADRIWKQGLERTDAWRWTVNSFWNTVSGKTFGAAFWAQTLMQPFKSM